MMYLIENFCCNCYYSSMLNDTLPLVSIIIATFNSGKVLPRVLEAVRKQNYPQNKIEIFTVDGGSTDDTREIAQKYNCIILDNPKTEPVYARFIGLQNAKGRYVITIDHDEVLANPDSIKNRVEALTEHPECKAALCSGYKRPDKYPLLNQYISDFGDPYSLYTYHCPKDFSVFSKFLTKKYKMIYESDNYFQFKITKNVKNLIVELICAATMIDLEYFKSFLTGNYTTDSSILCHLFYCMIDKGNNTIIVTKNDPLVHYSVDSLKAYWPKLKWRIINNVHFPEKAADGATGRAVYQKINPLKKYFFIIYSFTMFFPLLEGIILSVQRKNVIYLMHPLFCIYVAVQILWQYFRKIINKPPVFSSYDGKKKLER